MTTFSFALLAHQFFVVFLWRLSLTLSLLSVSFSLSSLFLSQFSISISLFLTNTQNTLYITNTYIISLSLSLFFSLFHTSSLAEHHRLRVRFTNQKTKTSRREKYCRLGHEHAKMLCSNRCFFNLNFLPLSLSILLSLSPSPSLSFSLSLSLSLTLSFSF